MRKIKMFLIGAFLSAVCLVFSVPVFAGNSQSVSQADVDDICLRLGFIERKILFETTKQLLNELNLILVILKNMETKMNFYQKNLVLEQFKSVLSKQELSDKLKNSDLEDRKLYDNLSYEINDAVSAKIPPTPKLVPKKFVGETDNWFWLSSIGTEEILGFGF